MSHASSNTFNATSTAFAGGIFVGAVMLGFSLFTFPRREWEIFFFILAATIGGLLAYFYQKRSATEFSLQKLTVIGGLAGLVGGVFYFGCTAIIVVATANLDVLLDPRSIMLAVIGTTQLAVAGGGGALVVASLTRVGFKRSARSKE